jgi:hypothetical protein
VTNEEFHIINKVQLLIPIMNNGECVECHKYADEFGYHHLGCTGTCNGNHPRHQSVRNGLFDVAVVAGRKPFKDPMIACTGESGVVLRPADLLVLGNNHPTMCIDTTIVSPFVVSASRPL